MDVDDEQDLSFLDTVEGEISLLRGITRARPVGIHRHWHLLTIVNSIKHETGRVVSPKDTWAKLETLYNLEALEDLDAENEGEELLDFSDEINLQTHPGFKSEFSLPYELYEHLITPRRYDDNPTSTNTRPSSPETPRAAGSGSRQSGIPTTGGSTSKDIGAFDSEGELTEEEEGLGGESENNDGSGAGDEVKQPSRKRARSRSVRTARSEALSIGVDDVEMAEAEDQPSPAPSGAGAKSSRRRTSAAATANASSSSTQPKKKPPPPPQTRTRNAAAAAAQAAAPPQRGKRKK